MELATLPVADAGMVVAHRLLDVGPLGTRLAALDRLLAGLAPGGLLVVVSADPERWADVADAVTRDLGGTGPLHADTWAHLLGERGGSDVAVRHGDGALVVSARW